MWADEIKKEHEHGNEVVSRLKQRKTLLCFVPSLELLIEAFIEIVGNIVLKVFYPDVPHLWKQGFDRDLTGTL